MIWVFGPCVRMKRMVAARRYVLSFNVAISIARARVQTKFFGRALKVSGRASHT